MKINVSVHYILYIHNLYTVPFYSFLSLLYLAIHTYNNVITKLSIPSNFFLVYLGLYGCIQLVVYAHFLYINFFRVKLFV